MRKTGREEKGSGGVYSTASVGAATTIGAAGCETIAATDNAGAGTSGFALTKFCRFCVAQPAAADFVGWQQ